jgi:hypothetical protein
LQKLPLNKKIVLWEILFENSIASSKYEFFKVT